MRPAFNSAERELDELDELDDHDYFVQPCNISPPATAIQGCDG